MSNLLLVFSPVTRKENYSKQTKLCRSAVYQVILTEVSLNHGSLFKRSLQSQVFFQVPCITVNVACVAWQLDIDGDERTFYGHQNNIVHVLCAVNEVIRYK